MMSREMSARLLAWRLVMAYMLHVSRMGRILFRQSGETTPSICRDIRYAGRRVRPRR
jgi:hypothetical protein